jgi:excisionase family DNA binding protein
LAERDPETDRDGSRTPAEAAQILRVPLRRVLEWLAAGEIEAERNPVSGRWIIPESALKGSEPARQTQEEMAWVYEKERLLAELREWRARDERERERAERLRDEVEGLRRELEVKRMRQGRRGGPPEP